MNTLGIAKAPGATRVIVAMSGGVDSSVTAALLAAEGYDVIGITLRLYDHGRAVGRSKACCAGQDIHDARRVAEALDIPHYVLDYEARFREQVVQPFADSYAAGETPIPCVLCNQTVKFTTCSASPATSAPMRWPPATTSAERPARRDRSSCAAPIRTRRLA